MGKRLTHRQVADKLGVPMAAVAIVREMLRGSSMSGDRALRGACGDVAKAARVLALERRCVRVAEAITADLVAGVCELDGGAE